jgi:N-6 DNA Methylase
VIAGISGDLLSSAYLAAHVGVEEGRHPPGGAGWMRSLGQWWRRAAATLGPASPPRALFDVGARPLLELLDLRVAQVERHAWGHAAVLLHGSDAVATLNTLEWGAAPSVAWRQALRGSPTAQLPWALVYCGDSVTVADATRPWSRRVLTFTFPTACRQPRALLSFWALASGPALRDGPTGWLASAIAASDGATTAVCVSLGRGVLDALQALVRELGGATRRDPSRQRELDRLVFDQSLTVVYRVLFLLFAEARQLVPMWHRVYRQAYSVQALCDRAIGDPRARGIWSALQAMARLAHVGCQAEDLRVTAFNGRLFAPVRTPLAERNQVPDRAAREVVLALGTSASREGRRRIAFDDLGVEQLGAVYERVLEYEPARVERTLTLRATSSERKTSGSFYSPRAMTDFLVRRTLGPLVEGRSADTILSLRVLDPAMGSGAFLVAACRYLSERVEHARLAEGTWVSGDVTAADRADVARAVAERCLYGIDRNPTAVQLARLSLWLATLSADRPLTFLEHHLAVGNSLVGARLADLPRAPSRLPSRDDRQPSLFDEDARQAWGRAVVPERHRLALDPSDTPAAVRAKERRLQRLEAADGASTHWARAADIWCGLALRRGRVSSGLYADLQRHSAGLDTALPSRDVARVADEHVAAARAMGAIHWELLFPEVFLDADGLPRPDAGFDAVIGNPPWEVVRGDTGDAGQRAGARVEADAMMCFIRSTDHYRLHASGHVNEYQLFAERAMQALGPRGRFGLILPAGLQCDVGSAGLRRALFDRGRLDTWVAFDNRRAIFPIHRSMRFLLLAGSIGGRTDAVPMSDGGSDVSCLTRLPDNPRAACGLPQVMVSRAFLDRWDPAHLTVPHVTADADLAVAVRSLDAPPLGGAGGWGVTFGRELNASDDRDHFEPVDSFRSPGRLPVIEGKHLRPFGVDLDAVAASMPRALARARLGDRWAHSRVCYRDVASASNRVTLIAAVLPAGTVSTHTVFCARTRLSDADAWCLIGLLNSLVANYLVRLQMSTHVTTTLMARLPVPRPGPDTSGHRSLVESARRLARCRSLEDDAEAYARLNAAVARLYGLTPSGYAHVVSTFPLLPATLRARCVAEFGA